MRRVTIIGLVALCLGGCSSQQLSWFGGQVWEAIDPPKNRYGAKYDEKAIFPTPNQKLACQMDRFCNKPLSKREFERLSDEDQYRVTHGGNVQSNFE